MVYGGQKIRILRARLAANSPAHVSSIRSLDTKIFSFNVHRPHASNV